MIDPNKKRNPSPLANLGMSQIARRLLVGTPDDRTIDAVAEKQERARAALALVESKKPFPDTASEEPKPKSKGGRPSTTGKPWEALGITRQAWYLRQRKGKPADGDHKR